ncbi:MAG: hypothetical protein IKX81_00175 [Firmicutes bacterium]|nr:hypothetical protein [Bacillota bacterium]
MRNMRRTELRTMKYRRFNKKGSYVVYLAVFLSGMLIMSGAVIRASHSMAVDSAVKSLGNVWAGNITAEYDTELRDRYGLYGFFANEILVKDKLSLYSGYSFSDKRYIDVSSIECDLSGYGLLQPENFRSQAAACLKSLWRPSGDFSGGEKADEETTANRYISADWILDALPSHSYEGGPVNGDNLNSVLEIPYIFLVFKDHVDDRDLGKTYFNNEVEYIISGKPDDEKARRAVYRELLMERNGLNLVYLYSCTEKRQLALEAAELITPGPEAVLTQALILETWALLEARNDLALLYDGEKVPLIKGDANWALSIENALNMEESGTGGQELDTDQPEKRYVRPERVEGQDYKAYLTTLLIAMPERTRLLRMMDLIQINMKYTYFGGFLLADYYTGLEYEMTVNGVNYGFKDTYEGKG